MMREKESHWAVASSSICFHCTTKINNYISANPSLDGKMAISIFVKPFLLLPNSIFFRSRHSLSLWKIFRVVVRRFKAKKRSKFRIWVPDCVFSGFLARAGGRIDDLAEFKLTPMKRLSCFKPIAEDGKLERRLSLGEYKRAVSWSKYLVSSGGEIKGKEEEEWSADMSQLFIGCKFATGRHSRVYRGVYKHRDVAIKLMSQPEEDEELASTLEKQFTSEVALLFPLRHPNIITFIAACKKPPVFCIITEYMAGGCLRKFLHQQEPHSLPLNLVLKLALDISRGMKYLHNRGILHRDLKSENLLLDDDMCVKVADFGISCLESQCGSAKGFTSTYRWMAPEMIEEKHHTKKVDVYSFGIVLWELITALVPFDNMTPEQAAFAVCQKNARPPLPADCPVAFVRLIERCWASNPSRRPGFDEIVSTLASYSRSLEQDPRFFSSSEGESDPALTTCCPRYIN